jgi:hypothetical protein
MSSSGPLGGGIEGKKGPVKTVLVLIEVRNMCPPNRSVECYCSINLLHLYPILSGWQNIVEDNLARKVTDTEYLWGTVLENISSEDRKGKRSVILRWIFGSYVVRIGD